MIDLRAGLESGPQHDERHERDARDRVEERNVDAERDIEHPEPRQQQPDRQSPITRRAARPMHQHHQARREIGPQFAAARSSSTAADAIAIGVVNSTGSMRAPKICQIGKHGHERGERGSRSTATAGADGAPTATFLARGCRRPRCARRRAAALDRRPARSSGHLLRARARCGRAVMQMLPDMGAQFGEARDRRAPPRHRAASRTACRASP